MYFHYILIIPSKRFFVYAYSLSQNILYMQLLLYIVTQLINMYLLLF